METKQILKDIGKRCQGEIYLGIVGPVRSGKSTFIKRFMEMAVIPYIEDPDVKIRTIDELPQSGKGMICLYSIVPPLCGTFFHRNTNVFRHFSTY